MSAAEARQMLIGCGHGATLCGVPSSGERWAGATPVEQIEHLAEIGRYIGESDPTMIVAAFLLEQDGYERSQLTLVEAE